LPWADRFLESCFFQKQHQVSYPVRITPLIVVPADDLGHVAADGFLVRRLSTMEEMGFPEVAGDQLIGFHRP